LNALRGESIQSRAAHTRGFDGDRKDLKHATSTAKVSENDELRALVFSLFSYFGRTYNEFLCSRRALVVSAALNDRPFRRTMFALDRSVAATEKESPNVARIDESAVSTYRITVSRYSAPPASTFPSKNLYPSRVTRLFLRAPRLSFCIFVIYRILLARRGQSRLKSIKSGTSIFIEVSSDAITFLLLASADRQEGGGGTGGRGRRRRGVRRGKLRGTGRRKNGHGSRTRGNLIDHRQSSRGPRKNSRILQHMRPPLPAAPRLRAR